MPAAGLDPGAGRRVTVVRPTRQRTNTTFICPNEHDRYIYLKETGYFTETPDGRPLVTQEAEETGLNTR